MATHTLDMTKGSVVKKLLLFALPILMSSLLQHLYTIADRVVVGNFAADGTTALAAVGATGHATNMLLNLFVGISLGANVVCSNLRGARNFEKMRKCMHTAVLLSVFFGVALMIIGLLLSETILTMMNTPADILPSAVTYMRIYFMGMPASLIYNFGAAILRSHGDAKRSMYILGCTGIVNVVLNLILVIIFKLDVEGVAIATIIAQYLSAVAVLWILFSPRQEYKLRLRELRIHKKLLVRMVAIGVPCGINGILQSVSNVILQSSVNEFGKYVIAGNTAATDINQFAYLVNGAFSSACVSFSGQCCGARVYKRLDKLAVTAALCNSAIVLMLAGVMTIFPRFLLGLFNPDPAVVEAGMFKLILLSWTTVFFGVSETMVGCVRGMGKSLAPTVVNIICLCGMRLAWVLFVFPHCPHDPRYLYLCYPVSWIMASVIQTGSFIRYRKQLGNNRKAVSNEI